MSRLSLRAWLALASVVAARPAIAGPPFLTDDPEPVEYGHWEAYLASQWAFTRSGAAGSVPHVEVNLGALPDVHLHMIVPAVLATGDGQGTRYGLGDLELGVKWRFVHETERRPQVGTFPLVLPATGAASSGLGAGKLRVLLPVWAQKSFGAWTTYGGGGVRLASGERDGVAGWLVQRRLGEDAAFVGAEGYVTAPLEGGPVVVQLDLGVVVNLSDVQHLLLSAGPAFGAGARGQAYLAYQLTR